MCELIPKIGVLEARFSFIIVLHILCISLNEHLCLHALDCI